MTNVGSLSGSGTVFDLDNQTGITHLLASIRSSALSTEQKNELRDLVFLYTNGGKDQTVRLALEQRIVSYQLGPAPQKTAVPTTPAPPPAPPIGTYRPAPSFSAPVATPAQPQPHAAPNFTAAPVWQPAPQPIVEAPVPPPPQPEPAPVAPVTPPSPPPQATVPVQSAAPAVSSDDQQYLKRIREIKALVNERVGNPVNLVDINNEVGREYMGALLDAMKKLNSGSSAASAMQRLETAFAAVNHALDEHAAAPVAAAPAQAAPAPAPQVAPPAYVPREPEAAAPVIQPKTTPIPNTTSIVEAAPYPNTTLVTERPSEPASEWGTPKPATPPAPPAATPTFPSLADVKEKPHTLSDLASSSSLKTATIAGDALFTKEVDDGLQALLMEWPIFKKSGLFGSGPKGKEHPLFKKMAPLQIPLLLAGRFEGATQEIKQSVTDYMNGWRYEQGLIYQQGETFEHYLRRVIRHILDLQKAK